MEQEILSLFTHNNALKFNQIEKSLNKRSNKLAYHLKKLRNKQLLQKTGDTYELTEGLESSIPYFSSKKAVIPVILIHIGNNKQAFLMQRTKRPYQNMLALPGGRLLQGESFARAAKRIALEKCNIHITPTTSTTLALEHVMKKGKIVHSFILIVVRAKAKVPLTSLTHNKKNIIASDYKLITQKAKSSIQTIISRE